MTHHLTSALFTECQDQQAVIDRYREKVDEQAKEIARLREALQACGSKLYEATAYIGYQGVGPLHEPATEMILRRAEEAIKETPV